MSKNIDNLEVNEETVNTEKSDLEILDLNTGIVNDNVVAWYNYPNWTMSLGVNFSKSFAIVPGKKVEIFIATSSGLGNLTISCSEFDFPNGDAVVIVPPNSTHTIKFTAPVGETNMTLNVVKGLNLPATVAVRYEY